MSKSVLSQFDGTAVDIDATTGKRNPLLYVAILGQVYDVSKSYRLYGPGQPYHSLTGKDATRAFALSDMDGLVNYLAKQAEIAKEKKRRRGSSSRNAGNSNPEDVEKLSKRRRMTQPTVKARSSKIERGNDPDAPRRRRKPKFRSAAKDSSFQTFQTFQAGHNDALEEISENFSNAEDSLAYLNSLSNQGDDDVEDKIARKKKKKKSKSKSKSKSKKRKKRSTTSSKYQFIDSENVLDSVDDLSDEQIETAHRWLRFLRHHPDYEFVGVVNGAYYDGVGVPRPPAYMVESALDRRLASKYGSMILDEIDQGLASSRNLSQCKTNWSPLSGELFYCAQIEMPVRTKHEMLMKAKTTSSTMKNSQEDLDRINHKFPPEPLLPEKFPRRVFHRANPQSPWDEFCACLTVDQLEHIVRKSNLRTETYHNCDPDAFLCQISPPPQVYGYHQQHGYGSLRQDVKVTPPIAGAT